MEIQNFFASKSKLKDITNIIWYYWKTTIKKLSLNLWLALKPL